MLKSASEDAGTTPLVYVTGAEAGIRRGRRGRGFCYLMPDGTPVKEEKILARIRALAIPPAYTDVWICNDPCGHIQATGRDRKGRKQYRYHKDWHGEQDASKFQRLAAFGRSLPKLPGQDLFQYLDEEGQMRDVTSADVNAYIRAIAGEQASAKDFRTWNGTVLAAFRALAPERR